MKGRLFRPRGYYQLKIALTYVLIVVVLLGLLNTYPVWVSQDIVFRAKQRDVVTRANQVAAALSGVDALEQQRVDWVLANLEESGVVRMVVVDDGARVIYDNSDSDSGVGKLLLLREVMEALDGSDAFVCRFEEGVFIAYAAVPVLLHGRVAGCVYVYEEDAEQGELLTTLQQNLAAVSLVILVTMLLVSAVVSSLLARRLGRLLASMHKVREGEYGFQTEVRGRDELSQLERDFNMMSDRLLATEAFRRQFVSDASHELKTPLASMKLLADSILQDSDMPPDLIREFVGDMGDEVDRLARMTDKLLTLTKLDAGLPPDCEPVDMRQVVLRTVRLLQSLAAQRGIRFETELCDDGWVVAEPDSCYQIVFNLAENAVKYSEDGGLVEISVARDGDSVVLRVRDNGKGIPAADQSNIFERFYRVDKARAREYGGVGLGLAIVSAAVQRFGGTIELESVWGQGSCFTVALRAR